MHTQTLPPPPLPMGPPRPPMLSDRRLRRHLLAVLAALVLLLLAAGGTSLYLLHSATDALDIVYLDRLPPLRQIRAVSDALLLVPREVLERVEDARLPVAQAQRELQRTREQADAQWSAFRAGAAPGASDAEAQAIAAAGAQIRTLGLLIERLAEALERHDAAALQHLQALQLRPASEALRGALRGLIELQTEIAHREAQQRGAHYRRMLGLVAGLLGLAVLLGIGLAWLLVLRYARERRASEAAASRQAADLALLAGAQDLAARARGEQELFDGYCRLLAEAGQARLASVALLRGGQLRVAARHGPGGLPERDSLLLLPGSAAGQALREDLLRGRVHLLGGGENAAAMGTAFGWTAAAGLNAALVLPLRRGEAVAGALALFRGDGGQPDDAALQLLQRLAAKLSVALTHLEREAARAAAERLLRDSLGRLQVLLDALPVEVFVLDERELRLLYLNDAACRRHGIERDALLQRAATAADMELPFATRQQLRALLGQDGAAPPGRPVQARVPGRADAAPAAELLLSAARIDYGERGAWLLAVQDLGELQQARQAQQLAQTENRAKSAFLSRLGHELRTPLHAVLGFAQLLQGQQEPLPERARAWVDGMAQAAWHLRALFDDMLDIARVELGQLSVQPARVDVAAVVEEALRMMQAQAAERGVALRAEIGPGGYDARADALRLRQVLLNLLSNALKYNRRGGCVRVELEPAAAGWLRLRVIDDGLGMDARQLARLFEPFNRLGREGGGIDGAGIGLALSRQLVLLMQGDIGVDSAPGLGTTVHLRLPAALPDAPPPPPTNPHQEQT